MPKKKQIETVVVSFAEYNNPEFHFPSKWAFRNGVGDFVFIKVSKREAALQYIQDNYDGRYSLREV